MEPLVVALAVAAAAFLIMALGLVGSLVDHHLERQAEGEARRLRRYIEELERQQELLRQSAGRGRQSGQIELLANMSHEFARRSMPLSALPT